jgi:toxin ParE1/3/4
MARIARTQQALVNLKEINRYVAEQSGHPEVARRQIERIDTKCQQYARSPELGELRDDLGENIRAWRVGNYTVLYKPIRDGILVLMIVHTARDLPTVFGDAFGLDS